MGKGMFLKRVLKEIGFKFRQKCGDSKRDPCNRFTGGRIQGKYRDRWGKTLGCGVYLTGKKKKALAEASIGLSRLLLTAVWSRGI